MILEVLAVLPASEMTTEPLYWVEILSIIIEVIVVIIIVVALLFGTINFVIQSIQNKLTSRERFRQYKHSLGKALLLSLEILIAADIIRTVGLEQTLVSVTILGLLVLIRTFLSWSLVVEIDGHWPWRPKKP